MPLGHLIKRLRTPNNGIAKSNLRIAWSLITGRFLMSVNPWNRGSLRKASRAIRAILSLKDPRRGIEEREEEKEEWAELDDLGQFAPSSIMLRCRSIRNLTFVR
jgi:hypothetical protein